MLNDNILSRDLEQIKFSKRENTNKLSINNIMNSLPDSKIIQSGVKERLKNNKYANATNIKTKNKIANVALDSADNFIGTFLLWEIISAIISIPVIKSIAFSETVKLSFGENTLKQLGVAALIEVTIEAVLRPLGMLSSNVKKLYDNFYEDPSIRKTLTNRHTMKNLLNTIDALDLEEGEKKKLRKKVLDSAPHFTQKDIEGVNIKERIKRFSKNLANSTVHASTFSYAQEKEDLMKEGHSEVCSTIAAGLLKTLHSILHFILKIGGTNFLEDFSFGLSSYFTKIDPLSSLITAASVTTFALPGTMLKQSLANNVGYVATKGGVGGKEFGVNLKNDLKKHFASKDFLLNFTRNIAFRFLGRLIAENTVKSVILTDDKKNKFQILYDAIYAGTRAGVFQHGSKYAASRFILRSSKGKHKSELNEENLTQELEQGAIQKELRYAVRKQIKYLKRYIKGLELMIEKDAEEFNQERSHFIRNWIVSAANYVMEAEGLLEILTTQRPQNLQQTANFILGSIDLVEKLEGDIKSFISIVNQATQPVKNISYEFAIAENKLLKQDTAKQLQKCIEENYTVTKPEEIHAEINDNGTIYI